MRQNKVTVSSNNTIPTSMKPHRAHSDTYNLVSCKAGMKQLETLGISQQDYRSTYTEDYGLIWDLEQCGRHPGNTLHQKN